MKLEERWSFWQSCVSIAWGPCGSVHGVFQCDLLVRRPVFVIARLRTLGLAICPFRSCFLSG